VRDTRIAWAAGLFDGEGCIGFWNSGKAITLRVVSTDRGTVDAIAATFGHGTVRARGPRAGRIPSFVWFSGAQTNVAEALRLMLPHSVTKAAEIQIALRYLDNLMPAAEARGALRSYKTKGQRRYRAVV